MEAKKNKILIVEDEATICNALRDKLAGAGFLVLAAKNGEEGLKAALKERPDMILLDILMPKMDGLAMLKQLRENAWGERFRSYF